MQRLMKNFDALWQVSKAQPSLVLVLALGSLLTVGLIIYSRRAAPNEEVLRTELKLRDGRLYHAGDETAPFTGWMIERYDSGVLKSRSMIANGVLHGVSEGWYTNGQLQVREHFMAGVSHALRTKWHENGVKMSEATVVDGKLQGSFRRWHENGNLAEQMELKHDTPDGLARSFYPSGFLKAQARLKDGKVTDQRFWKDGELSEASAAETTN